MTPTQVRKIQEVMNDRGAKDPERLNAMVALIDWLVDSKLNARRRKK